MKSISEPTVRMLISDPDFNPTLWLGEAISNYVVHHSEAVLDEVSIKHLCRDPGAAQSVAKFVKVTDKNTVLPFFKALPYLSHWERVEAIESFVNRIKLEELDIVVGLVEECPTILSHLTKTQCVINRIKDKDAMFLKMAETIREGDLNWSFNEFTLLDQCIGYPSRSMNAIIRKFGADKKFLVEYALRIKAKCDMRASEEFINALDNSPQFLGHKSWVCFGCNASFSSSSALVLHRRSANSPNSKHRSNRDKHASSRCLVLTPWEIITGKHRKIEHKCECGKICNSSSALTLHKKVHGG